MDKETFWATKSRLAEYEAIVFTHPAFDAPFRLVANQFSDVTLGGFVHKAVPMQIKPPDQRGDAQPKLTLAFPRPVVGREFKRQLALIQAASSTAPITVSYALYLGETTTPHVTWNLHVSDAGGVAFNGESVQVSATIDNPMRRAVGVIYDPSVFTGLETI